MNIDIKDVLELSDGNRYGVVSKTNHQNNTYYYLVDVANFENLKFCLEDNNTLIELEDPKLIQTLLPLFTKEIKEDLTHIFSKAE